MKANELLKEDPNLHLTHLEDLALSSGSNLNSWYYFGIATEYTNNGYQLDTDFVDVRVQADKPPTSLKFVGVSYGSRRF